MPPAGSKRVFGHFFITLLKAQPRPPKQIVLDLDATDPLHGQQEGRFFHGYYSCYCYLPLYVFCGRHLLAPLLRPLNIDVSAGAVKQVARIVARIRTAWPRVEILLRADSGFARYALMTWCEANRVDYVFGLAAIRAWSPSSKATWPKPPPSMPRRTSRRGASRSSAMPRWTAGAVRGA